jgi:hypothetical protein
MHAITILLDLESELGTRNSQRTEISTDERSIDSFDLSGGPVLKKKQKKKQIQPTFARA